KDTLAVLHSGNCIVYDIVKFKGQCDVGILVVNRDYWGRGYGREAVQLLVAQCFKNAAMSRLYLHTLEWNARARRAFAMCGFKEVKPVRRAGYNFILMELTREDWETRQDGA
ncbi:MAG: GNAT family N-acetyltransferase, partial [Chloroflexi bacterium]|nr:GNAT family N-acetyltransferase [Chloroflexota bacterium]